jgi:predicted small secreted protein
MRSIVALLAALSFAVTACTGEAGADDDSTTGPGRLQRAAAYVENVQFIFMESYPVQVRATIVGTVPTPCHEAVAEVTATDGDTVTVDVYSLVDPGAVCAEVLEPFEVTVDIGSFETGDYTLTIGDARYPFTI